MKKGIYLSFLMFALIMALIIYENNNNQYRKFLKYKEDFDDVIASNDNKQGFNINHNIIRLGDYIIYIETDLESTKTKLLALNTPNNKKILLYEDDLLINGLFFVDKDNILFSVIDDIYPGAIAKSYYKLNINTLKKEKVQLLTYMNYYFPYNKSFFSLQYVECNEPTEEGRIDYYMCQDIYLHENTNAKKILTDARYYTFYNDKIYYSRLSEKDPEHIKYDIFTTNLSGETQELLEQEVIDGFNFYNNKLYYFEDDKMIIIDLVTRKKNIIDMSLTNVNCLSCFEIFYNYNYIIDNNKIYFYDYENLYIIDINSEQLLYKTKIRVNALLKYEDVLFIQSEYLINSEDQNTTLENFKIKLSKLNLNNYKLEDV